MAIRLAARRSGAILAGFLTWAALAVPARADDFQVLDDPAQIDELASAVQRTSNALCWEMHRFHREKADFADAYRQAKEVWSMSGALRDALRSGRLDPANLNDQIARMNEALTRVERGAAAWGDGVRPGIGINLDDGRTVIVNPGPVDVEIPLLFGGIRVGGPSRMVVADGPSLPRRRFHPNAHGSRRALERELIGVRTAMNYLLEDTGDAASPAPASPATASPAAAGPGPLPPSPMPPDANPAPVLRISPPSAKKSAIEPVKK